MERLTDRRTAEQVRENIEKLRAAGFEVSVGDLRYVKLAEYEDKEEDGAADVQPVKRGKWIETHISLCKWIPKDEKEEGHSFYMAEMKCSCCKRYNTHTFSLTLKKPDFCQHCGARMNLKDGDTNG